MGSQAAEVASALLARSARHRCVHRLVSNPTCAASQPRPCLNLGPCRLNASWRWMAAATTQHLGQPQPKAGGNSRARVGSASRRAGSNRNHAQRASDDPIWRDARAGIGIDGQWRFCPVCGSRNPPCRTDQSSTNTPFRAEVHRPTRPLEPASPQGEAHAVGSASCRVVSEHEVAGAEAFSSSSTLPVRVAAGFMPKPNSATVPATS